METPVQDLAGAISWFSIAAQYPAAAGRNYTADSSTSLRDNLIWDPVTETLWSNDLNEEGLRLGFNIGGYALDFFHPLTGVEASYPLVGASHHDILKWLTREFEFCGIAIPFVFELPYDVPNSVFFDQYIKFPLVYGEIRTSISVMKTLALNGIERVSNHFNFSPDVLVLPQRLQLSATINSSSQVHTITEIGLLLTDQQIEHPAWYVEVNLESSFNNQAILGSLKENGWQQLGTTKFRRLKQVQETEISSVADFYLESISILQG